MVGLGSHKGTRSRRAEPVHHRYVIGFRKHQSLIYLGIINAVLLCAHLFNKTMMISDWVESRNVLHGIIENKVSSQFEPLLTDGTEGEWKRELFGRLDAIRRKCGVLCSINDKESFYKYLVRNPNAPPEGDTLSMKYFPPHLEASVNCRSLFELEEIDAGDTTFPRNPPEELVPFYELGGLAKVTEGKHFTRQYLGSNAMQNIWTEELIETQIQDTLLGRNKGTYGIKKTDKVFRMIRDEMDIKGKSVLVIGSEKPWIEAAALAAGAAKVTTLEYGSIDSKHPRIETTTPAEFRSAYLEGKLTPDTFDAVLSYSSLEHSGLGRYGDALNPWGDILSLARAWCTTKNGGSLLVDVPSNSEDEIAWNGCRYYSKYRWPLLTINWAPVGLYNHKDGKNMHYTRIFKKIPHQ